MIDQDYPRKNHRNHSLQSNQNSNAYIPSPRIIYPPQQKSSHPQVSEKYLKTIGLLRISWRNQKNHLVSINYGTAVALNCRTLLTCSHNIHSEKQGKLCSEIIFVPGLNAGKITDEYKQYKVKNTYNFCYSKPKTTFAYKPQIQQIAMIVLQEQLNLEYYMPVAELQSMIRQPLEVIGYPSQKYQATVDMRKVQVSRSALQGNLLRIQGYVVHHTMPTKSGHSGSPIIAFNRENKPYIIGIHTHRGLDSSYNSGIYFNNQNLKTLQRYQKKLCTINRLQIMNFFKRNTLSDSYPYENFQLTEDQSVEYLEKLIKQQLQAADRAKEEDDELQVRAQANQDREDDRQSDQSDMNEVVTIQNFDEVFLTNNPESGNNKRFTINKERNDSFRRMYQLL